MEQQNAGAGWQGMCDQDEVEIGGGRWLQIRWQMTHMHMS
jgi:hypothetical protein